MFGRSSYGEKSLKNHSEIWGARAPKQWMEKGGRLVDCALAGAGKGSDVQPADLPETRKTLRREGKREKSGLGMGMSGVGDMLKIRGRRAKKGCSWCRTGLKLQLVRVYLLCSSLSLESWWFC